MNEVDLSRFIPAQRAAMTAGALTYEDYCRMALGDFKVMANIYNAVEFTAEEAKAIEALSGPLAIYAIVGEGCSDVIASLPIIARIAERNRAIALHILNRSDHRDVANVYRDAEGNSRIPTYVLFGAQDREIGVLIERTAAITERVSDYRAEVYHEVAARFPGISTEELPADFVADRLEKTVAWRRGMLKDEQAEIVRWVVDAAENADRRITA